MIEKLIDGNKTFRQQRELLLSVDGVEEKP
jgi:hypothetical protein